MYRLSADAALRALLALDALPGDTSGAVLEFLRSLKTEDIPATAAGATGGPEADAAAGKIAKPE